jgi:hypothetical protein
MCVLNEHPMDMVCATGHVSGGRFLYTMFGNEHPDEYGTRATGNIGGGFS